MTPQQLDLTARIHTLRLELLDTFRPADPWLALRGREAVKRALIVAAAGNHSALLFGCRRGLDGVPALAETVGLTFRAAELCKCGNYADPVLPCNCKVWQIQRHVAKVRPADYEILVDCYPPTERELTGGRPGTTLEDARQRIQRAQDFKATGQGLTDLDECSMALLHQYVSELALSQSELEATRRVARTVADLESRPEIAPHCLSEAIQYSPAGRWRRL